MPSRVKFPSTYLASVVGEPVVRQPESCERVVVPQGFGDCHRRVLSKGVPRQIQARQGGVRRKHGSHRFSAGYL